MAGAPSIEAEFYKPFLTSESIHVVYNITYDLLKNATAALVTSGTATLETALFKVPEVVCYKGNALSFLLAKSLVKVKFISLVNLIMDKKIVEELIQNDFTTKNINDELNKILNDQPYRESMLKNMDELAEKLGGQGASDRTASLMISLLRSKN